MNSTKILFLKMLKGDIKRYAAEKSGVSVDNLSNENLGLLTGQTISSSQIESFSSYKLMNDDEKATVNSILDELRTNKGNEKGKALLKHIDSLVPHSDVQEFEYKDAS